MGLSFSNLRKLLAILIDQMDRQAFSEHLSSWRDLNSHDIWTLFFILYWELKNISDMVFEAIFEQMLRLIDLVFHSSLWDI